MKLIIVFVVVSVILMVMMVVVVILMVMMVVVVTCSDISGDAVSKGCYNEIDNDGGKIVMVVLMVKVMW